MHLWKLQILFSSYAYLAQALQFYKTIGRANNFPARKITKRKDALKDF